MNHIINFFDSLPFERVMDNLEFDTLNEQIKIAKGNNCYFFFFMKNSSMFKSNLCREIMFINEDNAHMKIDFNNSLAAYFTKKLTGEDKVYDDINNISQQCLINFEKNVESYPQLKKIYSKFKMEQRLPEKNIRIKKTKI